MIQRYRIAFLLSLLVFITLWAIYLHLPEIKKEPKEREKEVIKIALLSPAIPKKSMPKKIEVKKVIPKKIIKKEVTPKKIVKKVKIHKVQPKKILKKKVIKKKKIVKRKIIPKKIIKKKIIKKRVIKEKVIPQPPIAEPIIKPIEQPIIEPIQQLLPIVPPVYVTPKPITKPTIETPKIEEPAFKAPFEPHQKVKNDQYRKAFLKNVRSNIIANKKYPKLAKRRHIEGSVKVRFDITQSGEVTNIRFINGKRIFQKSIRKTLERTFPVSIPNRVRTELPINDVSVVLHFNII